MDAYDDQSQTMTRVGAVSTLTAVLTHETAAAVMTVLSQKVDAMRRDGADSVILGCTEITMLIGASDSELPLFDTTAIHAEAGVAWIAGSG